MRLLRLRLKNYIGIFNGMGLEDIEIDFSKCTHRILIIKGDNGTGKSTIFKALTPLSDSSINFIEEKTAIKEISYMMNDNTIVNIKYESVFKDKTRKPTKCYMSKITQDGTVTNINPTNNITTAKEIIYDLFGLDDNFIVLSQLSANKKGLGGLKPSERKKYVNNIVSSLSAYSEMNKLMTTKSSVLKSILASISTKLSQIGNIELVKSNIVKNEEALSSLKQKEESLVYKIASLNNKISEIDTTGNYLDTYKDLSFRKTILEKEMKDLPETKEYSEDSLITNEKEFSKYEAREEFLRQIIKDSFDKELSIKDEIDENSAKLESLYDNNILSDVKDKINSTKLELNKYEKFTYLIDDYINITDQDYELSNNAINKFNSNIDILISSYDKSIIEDCLKYENKPKTNINFDSVIRGLESSLQEQQETKNIVLELKRSSDSFKNIPSDCNHKEDCPFIKEVVESHKRLDEYPSLDSIISNIDSTNSKLEEVKTNYEKETTKTICSNEIKSIIDHIESIVPIINKFPNTTIQKKDIIHCIREGLYLPADLSNYIENKNIITIISSLRDNLKNLEETKSKIEGSSKESISLRSTLERLNLELDEVIKNKKSNVQELDSILAKKNEINTILNSIHIAKINKEKYEKFSKEYEEVCNSIKEMDKNAESLQSLKEELRLNSSELNVLRNDDLLNIKRSIEKDKYQLVLYDQYKKDYNEYMSKFNELQMLKKYTSIHGIQTVYMSVFMNSILQETNNLLRYLFGGRFALQPFIINESEFNIPCADTEGRVREDISLMSDSQLSMISMLISFVLLKKSSDNYNIIKLDEVDDNLDNINRIQFSILIEHIMSGLGFDQCLIISHNNELDLSNTDIVVLKLESQEMVDSLYNSGGNIIFSYNEYRK
jgi:hypothetical protein